MLLHLHVSWFETILAQQTGESSTVYDVVATGLLWLIHFKQDLVGLKVCKYIRTGDTGSKPTPVIWVACFKQSSFNVIFNLHSARKIITAASYILRNLNLPFHSCFWSSSLTNRVGWWEICVCILCLSSETKYRPLGGAQWSGEQECRRDGSSKTVFTVMRSRQEELWAAAVAHRFALDFPCRLQTHEYLNRKGTSSKHQSKLYLFNFWPQIWNVQPPAASDEKKNSACGISSHVDESIKNSPSMAGQPLREKIH